MAETYIVQLNVEDDEVDWEVYGVDKNGIWESLEAGTSAVYGDALSDASRVLKPFMPEWLR
jgi:hypothetical protein